ncbi:MAG: enoyl-CoA hydratase-related protein [Wenzhouxiangellaceae bacterium]|nr:enoyl-CoA hydratase-related protein [Wenzhouxiangellaceae bacterium]
MSFENLSLDRADGVATVTISRPEKLNALNAATLAELQQAFETLAEDDTVRAIILTGAGERAFVAGADISEIRALDPISAEHFAAAGQRLMRSIETLRKPVIAAINGFALGGGLELALACHLRYASDNARLGLPEIKLGILPGFGGTQRLTRLIGRGRALEMMLSGEPVTAETAARLGLVQRVVEAGALHAEVETIAQTLAAAAPLAVRAILEAVDRGLDMALDQGLAYETTRFALCCASEDMREGTAAFLEKRKPHFTGR